jgi:hypothetical protein
VIVDRACYCTREQVRRALDVKLASYSNDQVDRAIVASAEVVEGFAQRKFFPDDKTAKFDWPNYSLAYPWRVWLDNMELAAPATSVVTGTFLPVPIPIPINAIIFQPINSGPPFTSIELRRDLNNAFGGGQTPQLDIGITGTFGYWTKTRTAGTLAVACTSGDTTITVSDAVSIGVGDVLIAGTERMIVTDSNFIDTTINFSGLSNASAQDNVVMVPDGTKFTSGEVLMIDAEWILVLQILGNTMVVKRAWDASILTGHTGGTLWARRSLSVLRGVLGTTAASHSQNLALTVNAVPGLVRQLAIAEAEVWITQEPGAYGGASAPAKLVSVNRGGFAVAEQIAGAGLLDLRQRFGDSKYVRKVRKRAI